VEFRLPHSIRILPGVRLNLSESGISTSVGVKGAHVTLGGTAGTRTTVGLPGTGIRTTAGQHSTAQSAPDSARRPHRLLWVLLFAVVLAFIAAKVAGFT